MATHKSGEGLEGMYYEEAVHVDDSSGDTQLIPVSTACTHEQQYRHRGGIDYVLE